MKKKFIVSLSLLMLFASGCGKVPKLENGQEVVAEIEGKQFTAEDLYDALKEQGGTSTLISLIDKYISSQEFKDEEAAVAEANSQFNQMRLYYQVQGMDLNDLLKQNNMTEESYKKILKENYITTEIAKKHVKESFSDKEIEAYYNAEIFGAMDVRHILIKPEESDSNATDEQKKEAKEKALNKAKDLIKKLDEGASFEELAKEYSEDTGTKKDGGLFEGFLKSNTDSAFWEASYKLKDCEYTKTPVESAYGYHIILKISAKEKPSLESSKEEILTALTDEKFDNDSSLVSKTWLEIRDKYKLNIVETKLKDSYEETVTSIKNAK